MHVLLVSNTTNSEATGALYQAATWLDRNRISYDIASTEKLLIGNAELIRLSARISDFDLVCAFGGDGTILRAARVVGTSGVPLLGYNFGDLGFLAQATATAIIPALESYCAGELVTERRATLTARLNYLDDTSDEHFVLNEAILGRTAVGRVIAVETIINGTTLYTLNADGIIIATATGSTAYALSSGGSLLAPTQKGMIVVPISPHTFLTRSIVLDGSDIVELVPHPHAGVEPQVVVDGQDLLDSGSRRRLFSSLEVRRNTDDLLLVRYDTPDFYERVANVFYGGRRSGHGGGRSGGHDA